MTMEHFLKGSGISRENNGEDEPKQYTIYVYMEMSQQDPLYNYHILIHFFKQY
jgi:hypothetical protein